MNLCIYVYITYYIYLISSPHFPALPHLRVNLQLLRLGILSDAPATEVFSLGHLGHLSTQRMQQNKAGQSSRDQLTAEHLFF